MVYSKKEVEDYVKRKTQGRLTSGYDHFKRVYETAKKLAKQYDDEVLHAAAFLHEIEIDGEFHKKSAEHAKNLLRGKLAKDKLHHVEHAILHHVLDGRPKSVEAIILHDADLLDYLGIIGLIRIAFELRAAGKGDLKSIISMVKAYRSKISNSLILNQSKAKAADKLMFMDMAISEIEKELK